MRDRTRNVAIVAVVVIALGLIVWLSASASNSVSDLSLTLRRRSPVTEYQAAEAHHTDCRKNYEDAFMARVGFAIAHDRTDPGQPANVAELERLTRILGAIEEHCPTPVAPVFDEDGTMVSPPLIPSTTTATTVPLPEPGG